MDSDHSDLKTSFIKPFQFRHNQTDNTFNESFEPSTAKSSFASPGKLRNQAHFESFYSTETIVSSYYSHEGGEKYLKVQEMDFTLRKRFRFYSFWVWLYLIFAISVFFILSITLFREKKEAAKIPVAFIFLIYTTDFFLIGGILFGIYARMSENYEKKKIFIYTLVLVIVLLTGTLLFEFFMSIAEGDIYPNKPFLFAIPLQFMVIAFNLYFISRANKILGLYYDMLKVKKELLNEVYYRPTDESIIEIGGTL